MMSSKMTEIQPQIIDSIKPLTSTILFSIFISVLSDVLEAGSLSFMWTEAERMFQRGGFFFPSRKLVQNSK